METQAPSYRGEFLGSPHHVVFGLLTLGLGFLSGEYIGLIAGGTLYTLGWIYLPDMSFFRRWVDRRHEAVEREAELKRVAEFVQKRESMRLSLSPQKRERYNQLAEVCRDIERAGADSPLGIVNPSGDPRLRKLDELMWTFLRLLTIEESLDRFLEIERREDLPGTIAEAQAEIERLNAEIAQLKSKGDTATLETRQRFLNSRLERLEVLVKREQRVRQARENLALAVSEQERLDQQIKLIRADAVAARNTDALTARIDATVEHLDQTNKWLAEMDQFKDMAGDLPATEMRVGYEMTMPPPLPAAQRPRSGQRQKTAS